MPTADKFRTLAGFAHQSAKFISFRPRTDDQRAIHWKNTERVRRGFYGSMAQRIQKALAKQLDSVVENVTTSVRQVDHVMMAVRSATHRMRPIYEEAVRNLYLTVAPTFAELTLQSFPKTRASPLHLKQNGDEEDGEGSREDVWMDAVDRYVTQNSANLITGPNRTTRRLFQDAARTAVDRGVANGWGIDKIAREIRREADDAISMDRARTIARTETIRASNFGSIAAARSTGMNLHKEWIATHDDRVRQTHLSANKQRVPLESRFIVGGHRAFVPGDPALPPHESINCRCTVAYEPRT